LPQNHWEIAADLAYLRENWAGPAWSPCPPDDELQRGSHIIRRLLLEHRAEATWEALGLHNRAGHAPSITAFNIDIRSAPPLPPQYFILADTQFEHYAGMGVGDKFHMFEQSSTVDEFCASICAAVDGVVITRRQIVDYFCDIVSGITIAAAGDEDPTETRAELMGQIMGRVKIFQTEGLRAELRAIGRRITESKDFRLLEQAISSSH
jgi:hypothetical protein